MIRRFPANVEVVREVGLQEDATPSTDISSQAIFKPPILGAVSVTRQTCHQIRHRNTTRYLWENMSTPSHGDELTGS